MATRMKMLKLLQELRGFAQVTNRRPPARQPGLFMMELRASSQTSSRRQKRLITVSMHDLPDIPHPVKITHVKKARVPTAQAAD